MARSERVVVLPEARDALRKLAPAAKRRVRAALDQLGSDPALGEPLHRELTGRYRIRVGELRIVYRIGREGVEVVAIGARATIYAELERRAREDAAAEGES